MATAVVAAVAVAAVGRATSTSELPFGGESAHS